MTQEEFEKLLNIDFTDPEIIEMSKKAAKKMAEDAKKEEGGAQEKVKESFFKVVGQTAEGEVVSRSLIGRTLPEIILMFKDKPGHYTCYGFRITGNPPRPRRTIRHLKT